MLTQIEIQKEQNRLRKECAALFESQLVNGRDFFLSLFPNATIRAVVTAGEKSASARRYINFRIERIQTVVASILEAATSQEPLSELQQIDMEGLQMPRSLSHHLLVTLIRIISCGRSLLEDDLVFLGEVCASLDFPPGEVYSIIDQIQYESRKSFFSELKLLLDEDQQDLCAILLLTAIQADDSIHPAEFKYFENISQLLGYDQARLEHIGVSAENFEFKTSVKLPDNISVYIFEYLVEIVMCDRKYDPKESRFIQDVAGAFGFDKQRQDDIIQPVASTLMIKADLFQ